MSKVPTQGELEREKEEKGTKAHTKDSEQKTMTSYSGFLSYTVRLVYIHASTYERLG